MKPFQPRQPIPSSPAIDLSIFNDNGPAIASTLPAPLERIAFLEHERLNLQKIICDLLAKNERMRARIGELTEALEKWAAPEPDGRGVLR